MFLPPARQDMTRCQTHSQMRLSLGKKVDDKAGTWRRCRGNRFQRKPVFLMISIKSTNPQIPWDLRVPPSTPPQKKKWKSPQKKGAGERKPWKHVWKGETVKDWLKWWKKMKMIQKMGDTCGFFSEEACRHWNLMPLCLESNQDWPGRQVAESPKLIRKICLYSIVQLSS